MSSVTQPAGRGTVPRSALLAFCQAMAIDPASVWRFEATPFEVLVTLRVTDAYGNTHMHYDGSPVTREVRRDVQNDG